MRYKNNNKKILIAPLNWGLGHATRCVPIIYTLFDNGFEPLIAGDGDSLKLLQKEFPNLKSYALPPYNIQYTQKGKNLKFKLLFDAPRILKAIKKEQQVVDDLIKKENIKGIISDNRFGVRSDKIPSVYITHQINVLSGNTTFITSKFHQKIISKFNECWVPDYKDFPNLAEELSHTKNSKLNVKYIGPLSRFDNEIPACAGMTNNKIYDVMVLLSGPEPQRTILEKKLLNEFINYSKKVFFVRGLISAKEITSRNKNIEILNFLKQDDLLKAILKSEIIIARSGYSTIMDLEKLEVKAFFIPTPGQFEQEYLAQHLEKKNIASFSPQNNFRLDMLKDGKNYKGFSLIKKDLKKKLNLPLEIFTKC